MTAFFFFSLILYPFQIIQAQNAVWSIDDIRSSPQSPCFPVMGPNGVEEENSCRFCKQFIEQNASTTDRSELLNELSQVGCKKVCNPFEEGPETGWSFFVDQDLLIMDSLFDEKLNDDRNYTMGMGFQRNGSKYSQGFMADSRNWLDALFSVTRDCNQTEAIHGTEFGISAFTPDDIVNENPISGDRPYASLLYVANIKTVAYNEGHAFKTKLVLGVLGLSLARDLQDFIHNDLGASNKDPSGWHNQISDGGEFTALYSLERIAKWDKENKPNQSNWDLSYSLGGNIGYYVDAFVGLDLRVGKISTPYYAHSANPLSMVNHGVCKDCGKGGDNYGFFSYRVRLVAFNALLQGQTKDNPVEFSSSEIENVLHEIGIGWTWHIDSKLQITYAMNYKSEEYKGIESRPHYFGGLYFSRSFE